MIILSSKLKEKVPIKEPDLKDLTKSLVVKKVEE